MKRALLTVLALLPMVVAPALGMSESWEQDAFVGLWEGVDPGDGSLTQRAITCDENGACLVLGSDSFFTLCGSARGLLRGDGTISDVALRVPGFTLTCADDAENPISVDTTFTLDRANGTLLEKTVNPNIQPITFHKMSKGGGARKAD